MQKNPRQVHLLGCGDLGTGIARALLARGDKPLALRRNPGALPADLPAMAMDYTDPASLKPLLDHPADISLLTPTPAGRDVESYRAGYLRPVENLLALWSSLPPQALIYVSSTRVYGDAGGDWVDENSPLYPADGQGEILAEAERLLLESPHRVTVVRFSGIYGRLPSRVLERVAQGDIVKREPLHYTNRIHRDDCVGFLLHLLDDPERDRLYLASDNEPAPMYEVERWLAGRLGVDSPRETVEPPATNRRCNNRRLRESGYALRYPDYRSGYSAMMTSTSMSAPFGSAAT